METADQQSAEDRAAALRVEERRYRDAFIASLVDYASRHGLNGEQMADRLKIHPATYSRIISGREREPKIGRAARFARILGIPLDEMVDPARAAGVELDDLGREPGGEARQSG